MKKPSSKQTLSIEAMTKRWPEVTVCENFRAVVTKGEKIAIIGKTGVGKTTLCKLLMGELKPDAGKIDWGTGATLGYLAQDHREGIAGRHHHQRLAALVRPTASLQDIRGLLGRMLFKGEEGTKPTDALSAARRCGSIFSKLMLAKDNVLILDEPTQPPRPRVDRRARRRAHQVRRTAFVVTHDRDLVMSFATRIFAFTDEGLVDWQGTLRGLRRAQRRRGWLGRSRASLEPPSPPSTKSATKRLDQALVLAKDGETSSLNCGLVGASPGDRLEVEVARRGRQVSLASMASKAAPPRLQAASSSSPLNSMPTEGARSLKARGRSAAVDGEPCPR